MPKALWPKVEILFRIWLSLDEIYKNLAGHEGKRVRLELLREGKRIRVVFRLEKYTYP